MTHEIINIFPTPMLSCKNFLPEQHINELHNMLKNCEYTPTEFPEFASPGLQASVSNNILKQFPIVKNEIIETFKEYAYNIIKVDEKLDFKMGSSWGVKILPGGMSRKHIHANYYYSGCLYVTENPSSIEFLLGPHVYNYHDRFLFKYSEVNQYNANKVTYDPQINEILFFPAYLKHQVSRNNTDENRYSIAFNIHPSGIYGKHDSTIHIEVIDDLD